MKIFWTALAALAVLGSLPVMAYQDSLLSPHGHERTQPRQRGQENVQPRQKAQESNQRRWESRQQGQEPMPWESRPWEQRNATDEGHRPGKRARKEQFEQQELRGQNPATQPQNKWQNKWQRHQTEGERFNAPGLPPR